MYTNRAYEVLEKERNDLYIQTLKLGKELAEAGERIALLELELATIRKSPTKYTVEDLETRNQHIEEAFGRKAGA